MSWMSPRPQGAKRMGWRPSKKGAGATRSAERNLMGISEDEGGAMFRRLIAAAAATAALAVFPPGVFAQPPSPPEIVHKVDRGVKHVAGAVDRKVRGGTHRTRRAVPHPAHPSGRALCNDGRGHVGRPPTTARLRPRR